MVSRASFTLRVPSVESKARKYSAGVLPSWCARLSKLSYGPLFQQHLHLLAREALSEPGRALAGQHFGEIFAASERMERREQRSLGVRDDLGHGRDPRRTLSERLEPEPQGFHLYLEVQHLGREVLGQSGDDWARKRDRFRRRVLGEPLVQDALVCPVLVEDN